jgi:hypothetical protein
MSRFKEAVRKRLLETQSFSYVISAHANEQINRTIEVPENMTLHYFTDLGEEIVCPRHAQTEVCAGKVKHLKDYMYGPGELVYDSVLSGEDYDPSDEESFLAGVVECGSKDKPIVQIYKNTTIRLSEIIQKIQDNERRKGRSVPILVHCLFCRSIEYNGVLVANGKSYNVYAEDMGDGSVTIYTEGPGTEAVDTIRLKPSKSFFSEYTLNGKPMDLVVKQTSGKKSMKGGKTRRVKQGGIPRDVVEGLADAYQKGVADAKMVIFKRYQTPPGFRLEQVIRPLVRKHPGVAESRIREEYVKGFTETRLPNPGGNTGGRRRKTRRGGVSKEMVDALREAENTGRIHKTVGDPSQADSVADSLMRRFRLVDVGTPPTPRTLLRDKYLASYSQASRATTRGSFLESLQGRIANLLS